MTQVTQTVNISCACDHPFPRGGAGGGGAGAVAIGIVLGLCMLLGKLTAATVSVTLRALGPAVYFACQGLCLVGEVGKRLAPGISAVGEQVGELAQLGSGGNILRLGSGDDDGI